MWMCSYNRSYWARTAHEIIGGRLEAACEGVDCNRITIDEDLCLNALPIIIRIYMVYMYSVQCACFSCILLFVVCCIIIVMTTKMSCVVGDNCVGKMK